MSLILTERLIQRQLNHWNRMRAFLRDKEPNLDLVETGSMEGTVAAGAEGSSGLTITIDDSRFDVPLDTSACFT